MRVSVERRNVPLRAFLSDLVVSFSLDPKIATVSTFYHYELFFIMSYSSDPNLGYIKCRFSQLVPI